MAEKWKPVPGYEGLYEVSDMGKVKRLPRTSTSGTQLPEKRLKWQKSDASGHRIVRLRGADGTVKNFYIHRLVMLAFVGPCPEGMEICHNDGRGYNNRLENLRYDTREANMVDRSRMGRHPSAKLDADKVKEIRRCYAEGESMMHLAKRFGVARESVFNVVKRKYYTWVE